MVADFIGITLKPEGRKTATRGRQHVVDLIRETGPKREYRL